MKKDNIFTNDTAYCVDAKALYTCIYDNSDFIAWFRRASVSAGLTLGTDYKSVSTYHVVNFYLTNRAARVLLRNVAMYDTSQKTGDAVAELLEALDNHEYPPSATATGESSNNILSDNYRIVLHLETGEVEVYYRQYLQYATHWTIQPNGEVLRGRDEIGYRIVEPAQIDLQFIDEVTDAVELWWIEHADGSGAVYDTVTAARSAAYGARPEHAERAKAIADELLATADKDGLVLRTNTLARATPAGVWRLAMDHYFQAKYAKEKPTDPTQMPEGADVGTDEVHAVIVGSRIHMKRRDNAPPLLVVDKTDPANPVFTLDGREVIVVEIPVDLLRAYVNLGFAADWADHPRLRWFGAHSLGDTGELRQVASDEKTRRRRYEYHTPEEATYTSAWLKNATQLAEWLKEVREREASRAAREADPAATVADDLAGIGLPPATYHGSKVHQEVSDRADAMTPTDNPATTAAEKPTEITSEHFLITMYPDGRVTYRVRNELCERRWFISSGGEVWFGSDATGFSVMEPDEVSLSSLSEVCDAINKASYEEFSKPDDEPCDEYLMSCEMNAQDAWAGAYMSDPSRAAEAHAIVNAWWAIPDEYERVVRVDADVDAFCERDEKFGNLVSGIYYRVHHERRAQALKADAARAAADENQNDTNRKDNHGGNCSEHDVARSDGPPTGGKTESDPEPSGNESSGSHDSQRGGGQVTPHSNWPTPEEMASMLDDIERPQNIARGEYMLREARKGAAMSDHLFGGQANNRAIEEQKAAEKQLDAVFAQPMTFETLPDNPETSATEEPSMTLDDLKAAIAARKAATAEAGPLVPRPASNECSDADTGELIPLDIDNPQEPRVNARDLHTFLESGWKFADWIVTRSKECDLVKDEDFGIFQEFQKNPSGGRPTKEYWLTLDAAKEVAMMERNDRGKAARRYFIECEKRLRATPAPVFHLPQTFAEALRLLADSSEVNEQLKLENRELGENLAAKEEELVVSELVKNEVIQHNAELLAHLDRAEASVRVWDFFPLTRGILGMSRTVGYRICRQLGILGKPEKNSWGADATLPLSKWAGKGYFTTRTTRVKLPVKDAQGRPTGEVHWVPSRTTSLTPDRKDANGNVTKTGGYAWLLNLLYNDERCLLYRLAQQTGGADGQFRPLYGGSVVRCQDQDLPSDPRLSHGIIRYYKPIKSKGETTWRVARQIGAKQYLAEGLTLAEALTRLNAIMPKNAPRALSAE